MVNPNSYDSVQEVLLNLEKTIVNDCTRKWTIVGADGILYLYGARRQGTLVCPQCHCHISKQELLVQHMESEHRSIPFNSNDCKLFPNLL